MLLTIRRFLTGRLRSERGEVGESLYAPDVAGDRKANVAIEAGNGTEFGFPTPMSSAKIFGRSDIVMRCTSVRRIAGLSVEPTDIFSDRSGEHEGYFSISDQESEEKSHAFG
jgi:hypothetical protein